MRAVVFCVNPKSLSADTLSCKTFIMGFVHNKSLFCCFSRRSFHCRSAAGKEFLQMADLFSNVTEIQWQMVVMWVIGGLLIWLAIKKEMEPTLLLPMGFGAILVTCPGPARWIRPILLEWNTAQSTCCLTQVLPTSCSRFCCSSALVQ